MKLRFEPRLAQAWVLEKARRDIAFRQQCQQRLEPIYELPEAQRAEAFTLAYRQLFAERGLSRNVEAVLQEFPPLQDHIEEALVLPALSRREEAVELSADRARLGLRLRLQRLADFSQLAPFLRHELLHITDLLDEAFGYRVETTADPSAGLRAGRRPLDAPPPQPSPSEGEGVSGLPSVVGGRYRVLWDISIDSRLLRAGKTTAAGRDDRRREFERAFSFLPVRERRAAFETLWQAERVTHEQLLRWARDPTNLVAEMARTAEMQPLAPIPGSLCPLCRFPTHAWTAPAPEMVAVIQTDFPDWTPENGLCERCYECYQTSNGRRMTYDENRRNSWEL